MKKKTVNTGLILLLVIFTGSSQSQKLFMPLEFQRAYEKGTRSYDGNPGPEYWQNSAQYKIKAKIDPTSLILFGEEEIIYKNNSPEALRVVIIKVLQDIYKKGSARDMALGPDLINDGMEISELIVGGDTINVSLPSRRFGYFGTNLYAIPESPIATGETVNINIKWNYTLAWRFGMRTGAVDSTSFFVGYWYPQIAVYDDIDGWDVNSYTGIQETYNDFADYEVEITLPDSYMVWATGELKNEGDLIDKNILKRINESRSSDEVVHILQKEDYETGKPGTSGVDKTWKFSATNVPDFAWAASDHYIWDATSLVVVKTSERRVWISAVYPENAQDFDKVCNIARKSVDYFSKTFPGVPFPYSKHTTFKGSFQGGMEFPMMANNNTFPSEGITVEVTAHEIGHTYFPFYMGINERKYAWMDEGWASLFGEYVSEEMGFDPSQSILNNTLVYSNQGATLLNTPLMVSSTFLNVTGMTNHYYAKPSQANKFLLEYLESIGAKDAFRNYIRRWNGKHPMPYDFFFTMNDFAGEDLSWFWIPWYFEFGYTDLGIGDVQTGNGLDVTVEMIGNQPVPVALKVTFEDESVKEVYETAGVWKNQKKQFKIHIDSDEMIKKIELGNNRIPDVNQENNVWESKESSGQ